MIYLIRHGQTDWNLYKRFNGTTDTYLNQTGIEQAKLQIKNLKNIDFDVCYCSPQTRAVQYGKPIEYDFSKTAIEKGGLLMLDNLR